MLRRLGINAVFLEPQMGGIETYTRQLLPALLDVRPSLEIMVFVNNAGRQTLAEEAWASSVTLKTHPLLGPRGARAVGEALLLGPLAKRAGCELLHSHAMTAPLRPGLPSVVTVPDVTWLHIPGAVPRSTRLLWRTLVVPAARAADRVITHSNAARRDISADLGIPEDRIDVVPHGPGGNTVAEPTPEQELRERLGLGAGPIVLAVSALLAHKNLSTLVEAMAIVQRETPEAVLVAPANRTPLQDELEALAARVGSTAIFPGWVSAAEREGLYRAAACFAFPSIREGFGLPVLEAMRHGVPVVCSNTSAVPEVAGDAALLVDPRRPDEFAGAISRVLADPRLAASLRQRGKDRAAEFSWRRTAEETLASYDRALA